MNSKTATARIRKLGFPETTERINRRSWPKALTDFDTGGDFEKTKAQVRQVIAALAELGREAGA